MANEHDEAAFNEMNKATSSKADEIMKASTKDISMAKMFTTEDKRLFRQMQMRGEPRDELRREKGRSLMEALQGITMYLAADGGDLRFSKEEKDIASGALEGVRKEIRFDSREEFDILLGNYMKHFNKNFAHKQSVPDPYIPLKDYIQENISHEPLRRPKPTNYLEKVTKYKAGK